MTIRTARIPRCRAAALTVILSTLAAVTAVAAGQKESAPTVGAEHDPAEVIAYRGDIVLTQQELDAVFTAVPKDSRLAFIRDGGKVDQLIMSLLQRKAIARDAQHAGYDKEPLVAERVALAAQKELAEAWLQHRLETAPEVDFEQLALEDYTADPEAYRSGDTVDVSQILIGLDNHSQEEAGLLAAQLYEKLKKDPSQFDALVMEYSEDPLKAENKGHYLNLRRGQTVKPFEAVAFGLQQEGDISKPVKTKYGYHILRLDKRHAGTIPPFDLVRDRAVQKARLEYLKNYQQDYLLELTQEPIVIPDGAVEIMAKRWFGEDLEKAPDHQP